LGMANLRLLAATRALGVTTLRDHRLVLPI